MSDPTRTREALRRAQIRCKSKGQCLTLRWQAWPNGRPTQDPVTGAFLPSSSLYEAVEMSCPTKAFTHYTLPTSTVRQFSEVQVGDMIADFVLPLVSVATAGNTTLAVGQVCDIVAFNAANRALSPGQTPATYSGYVHLEDLPNCEVDAYPTAQDQQNNTNASCWVQAKIGDDLARSWESVFCNLVLGHSVLLRKKT